MWTAKPSVSQSEVPEQHRGLTILGLETMVALAIANARNHPRFETVVVSPSVIASMMPEVK